MEDDDDEEGVSVSWLFVSALAPSSGLGLESSPLLEPLVEELGELWGSTGKKHLCTTFI